MSNARRKHGQSPFVAPAMVSYTVPHCLRYLSPLSPPSGVTKRIRDSSNCQQRYEVRRLFGCHNALLTAGKLLSDERRNFSAVLSGTELTTLSFDTGSLRPASTGQIASLPPTGATRPLILCNQSTHSM